MKKLFRRDDNWSPDVQTPLKQNWRAFLKAQPLICDNCGNFTDTPREYCESCGFRHSLRKATKKDFNDYRLKGKTFRAKFKPKLKKKISESPIMNKMSKKEEISFLKSNPFFCVKCYNFTDKPEPKGPQKPEKFYYETYCEFCGSSDSIRVATKKDFELYYRREQYSIVDHIREQKKLSKQKEKISSLKISETQQISSQLVKNEDISIVSSKPQLHKATPSSNNGKEKISVKPISGVVKAKTDDTSHIISPIDKVKDTPGVTSLGQIENIPSIPDVSKPEISEEPIFEESKIKTESLKQIPSISVKKDERSKEIAHFCKFCGIKLAKMAKFCHQCGTIIKYK